MKIVFLEAATLGDDVDLSQFESLGTVVKYPLTEPEENAKRCMDADVVVLNKIRVDASLLEGNTTTKLVCLTATGTNNVDFAYTNSRGIAIANVKGYSTESVVQHTFALLFFLLEKMAYYDNFVKSGEYTRCDVFSHFEMKFHELYGKTIGIVGLGNIGKRVAEVAKCFGCKVIYYSTSGAHDEPGMTRVSLEELMKTANIVSVHAPLNAQTTNLIGEAELALMKKDGIILNLGRGGIINEAALAKAIANEQIGGAGLDVLTREPMTEDNPLFPVKESQRLVITPHIAWATVEARSRCADEVFENIKAFYRGEERNICK